MGKNCRRTGKRSRRARSDNDIPCKSYRKGRIRRRREERNLMQYRFFVRTPARRIALFLIFALSLSSFALSSFGAFAQDEKQEKQDKKNEDRKKEKAKKSKEKKVKSVYKRRKNEDVRWITTDEERKIFDSLKTDDEREQFIEGFWYRRDPDPDTDVNEYREEYYQRIAYANEH